ncbi:MAG: hypothetical protein PHQ86_07725 [Dehalococcoidales bacterium]|nr:hypothetical protein [Dehalococcoidales bacterium]
MKQIMIDILFGIFTMIVVTTFEFSVTLPFGDPGELDKGGYSYFINLEFLLTALPAAIVTFMFTWLLKTKHKSDSVRRAIVWTIMVALYYVLIGLGNDNLTELFLTIGIYVMLVYTFADPIIYAKIKYLR